MPTRSATVAVYTPLQAEALREPAKSFIKPQSHDMLSMPAAQIKATEALVVIHISDADAQGSADDYLQFIAPRTSAVRSYLIGCGVAVLRLSHRHVSATTCTTPASLTDCVKTTPANAPPAVRSGLHHCLARRGHGRDRLALHGHGRAGRHGLRAVPGEGGLRGGRALSVRALLNDPSDPRGCRP
ncbi:hypothetical protein GmRootV35_13860 [Variovorax sp. V35]